MVLTEPVIAWLAYYDDWSGMAVFSTEIEALRFAVGKGSSMSVAPLTDGQRFGPGQPL